RRVRLQFWLVLPRERFPAPRGQRRDGAWTFGARVLEQCRRRSAGTRVDRWRSELVEPGWRGRERQRVTLRRKWYVDDDAGRVRRRVDGQRQLGCDGDQARRSRRFGRVRPFRGKRERRFGLGKVSRDRGIVFGLGPLTWPGQ